MGHGNTTWVLVPDWLVPALQNHDHKDIAVAWVAMGIFLLMALIVIMLRHVNWSHEDSMRRVLRILLMAAVVYGVSAEQGWIPVFGTRRVNVLLAMFNAWLAYTSVWKTSVRVYAGAMASQERKSIMGYGKMAQLVWLIGVPVQGSIVYLPFVFGMLSAAVSMWWLFSVHRKTLDKPGANKRSVWFGVAFLLGVVADPIVLLLSQGYIGVAGIAGGIVNMMSVHIPMIAFLIYTEREYSLVVSMASYRPDVARQADDAIHDP